MKPLGPPPTPSALASNPPSYNVDTCILVVQAVCLYLLSMAGIGYLPHWVAVVCGSVAAGLHAWQSKRSPSKPDAAAPDVPQVPGTQTTIVATQVVPPDINQSPAPIPLGALMGGIRQSDPKAVTVPTLE